MKNELLLVTGWSASREGMGSLLDSLNHFANAAAIQPDELLAAGASYAEALVEHLASLSGDRVLAGWSMGGLIAMESYLRQPLGIRGLVLIGSSARFSSADDYPCGHPPAGIRALKQSLLAEPELTLRGFYQEAAKPFEPIPDYVESRIRHYHVAGIDDLLTGLRYLAECDLRDRLSQIQAPVLVLHGTADVVIPAEAARFLASHLPDATLKLFEGESHDLPMRQPAAVAKAITDWITEKL